MAHVALIFEDDESGEGGVAFKAKFAGGEDKHSNAHRLANQVIHWLDEQATKKTGEVVTPLNPDIIAPRTGQILR